MSDTRKSAKGMTEAEWLTCADPLRMPKWVRHNDGIARRFCLLACAHLLDAPGGFRNAHARRVVEAVRAAALRATDKTLTEQTRPAARGLLPAGLPEVFPGLWQQLNGREEFGADGGRLAHFLSACAFAAASVGDVNNLATASLARVRYEAHRDVWAEAERLKRQHGAATDAYREAVYALIPEPERTAVRGRGWQGDHVPAWVTRKLYATAARPRVEAAFRALADLVREVLGNPFRPSKVDPAWPEWNHGAVRHIAEQIEATANFADLPILADALEEAGCTDEHLLRHCREDRVHVPGCWALDAILGRG
jgi:hypothetical protein